MPITQPPYFPTFFSSLPRTASTMFRRIRRTTGTKDTYGDATFTETQTSNTDADVRGFAQWDGGQAINLAGREVAYNVSVWTNGTFGVNEDDVLLLPSSTATALSTRYYVRAVKRHYRGASIDHTEIFAAQEVL